MRVVEVQRFGGPEVLALVDRPDPVAGENEVLVRVRASTINPVDRAARAGRFPQLTAPLVLGWDFAGTVDGRPVVGMVPWFVARRGTNADFVAVHRDWFVPLPDGADPIAAATVPLSAQTAKQALDLAGVQAGQTLLVTGAGGGVGGFAVQLAAAAGVHVVAMATDADYVSSLGAKSVIGRGDVHGEFDAVLDAGIAGPQLITAVRDGGTFVGVNAMAKPEPVRGIRVDAVQVKPDRDDLDALITAFAAGRLRTRVAGELPAEQAVEAHTRADAGVAGKFVLTF
ncbi:NADP-dependent oxidoreductase [Kutzneria buriramensis]|uniref:NADPH:quinone reductase-like Zn-dependent oxidoreductase n=1 Tax=Kutzneria buriramensis TaxID=1045776 RepID=A0A3E0I773_9PSEU|nr:NADP-dependent oxidoreductase [Kutzneria buriramensis]REH54005.1 NADPH:quinone reductase-like Zn-dependent oxidoreductase [Kutzneria buriramensis]